MNNLVFMIQNGFFKVTDFLNSYIFASGLEGVYEDLKTKWIGPAMLIAVAVFSLVFLKNRELRKLAVFIAVAAVVGGLIFFGKDWFGSQDSVATGAASELVQKVGSQ